MRNSLHFGNTEELAKVLVKGAVTGDLMTGTV